MKWTAPVAMIFGACALSGCADDTGDGAASEASVVGSWEVDMPAFRAAMMAANLEAEAVNEGDPTFDRVIKNLKEMVSLAPQVKMIFSADGTCVLEGGEGRITGTYTVDHPVISLTVEVLGVQQQRELTLDGDTLEWSDMVRRGGEPVTGTSYRVILRRSDPR